MKDWNVESNSDNAKNLTGTMAQWSVDSQDSGTVATSAMDVGRTIITITCMSYQHCRHRIVDYTITVQGAFLGKFNTVRYISLTLEIFCILLYWLIFCCHAHACDVLAE